EGVKFAFCRLSIVRSAWPESARWQTCNSPRRLALTICEETTMNRFVTHLESALDGTRFEADAVHTVHQGRPLLVRYDLDRVRRALAPTDLGGRTPSLWRYRELLPLPFDEEPVTFA